ncbi:MAG: hypothetical protein IJ196_04785 [Prevotella sp.]|nr:hypothetical protein [Prevotella sp.]
MKKKILILGGAAQHLKLVEAAKRMGHYTIVTDYLANSPCKAICDEAWDVNVRDVDGLEAYCNENLVDGVIAGFIDPCQIPYSELCTRLNKPCLGTPGQFYRFTNKNAFKKLCRENGVDVIPDYTEDDVREQKISFPVFVKPVDSRGSRGQSVCYDYCSLDEAMAFAKSESSNGEILIEQYLGDCDEFQVTYFVVNGEPHLERTCDSYRGSESLGLQKLVNCSISPSRHTEEYLRNAHSQVEKMIAEAGITNGPVFMQGFVRDGQFFFFDPGLRFPGVEYERMLNETFGFDICEWMVEYALTGHFPSEGIFPENAYLLNGHKAAILFPVLKNSVIDKISGLEKYRQDERVKALFSRYVEGEEVQWTATVSQRFAEVDLLGSSIKDIIAAISKFQQAVSVRSRSGEEMLIDSFMPAQLLDKYS